MVLRAAAYLLCLLALPACAGCGLKGPLYLPTPKQLERETERAEELRKRREQREREAEQESAEREQRQTY
jgi:predicted small lipoprotein YifL